MYEDQNSVLGKAVFEEKPLPINDRYATLEQLNTALSDKVDKDELNTQMAEKADKTVAESAHSRIDTLVIASGNANAEVDDAKISTVKNRTYSTLRNRLEDGEKDVKSINSLFNISKNLFDKSVCVDKIYTFYRTGEPVADDTSASSGKQRVEAGKTYTISMPIGAKGLQREFRCWSETAYLGLSSAITTHPVAYGVTVSHTHSTADRKYWTIAIASDSQVRYIETTIIYPYEVHDDNYFQQLINSIQLEEGTTPTQYHPKDAFIEIKREYLPDAIDIDSIQVELAKLRSSNVLWGKVLATAGDSITYGADMDAGGIDTDGSLMTYGYLIAKRNNMTFHNYAISGSTMQDIPTKNGFSATRYQTMETNIDYLTIWFGWNDAAYGQLGTIADTDPTASYYGGWNTVLPWLIQNYPKTKIGLIVPFYATAGHRQAVRNVGNKWGIPYLDLYSANTPFFYGKEDSVGTDATVGTMRRSVFQANGAHPSSIGHAYLSTIIENFLRSL